MSATIETGGTAGGSSSFIPPPKWSCQAPDKGVRVEVRLSDNEWIEIPTTDVETHLRKGQAADVQRTAKVEYPYEWDGESVNQVIEAYQEDIESEMQWARVQYNLDGDWYTVHLGWVGGTGGTQNEAVGKFYIYDAAEIFTYLYVSHTFNNPSVSKVVRAIYDYADGSTSIPLSGSPMVIPQNAVEDNMGDLRDEGGDIRLVRDMQGEGSMGRVTGFVEEEDTFSVGTLDVAFDLGTKQFQRNRHTIKDVIEWLKSKTVGRFYFEVAPDNESLTMVFDGGDISRRVFQQREAMEDTDLRTTGIVDIIENTALNEMRPVNTITAVGAKSSGVIGDLKGDILDILEGSSPEAEEFPYAKVRHEPLYRAAGEHELGESFESDATTLGQAEQAATQKLVDQLNETTEGNIEMYGYPVIMPHDRIVAYETCPTIYEDTGFPVSYEVDEVIHKKNAESVYKTMVRISIWANETNIETVERGHAEA